MGKSVTPSNPCPICGKPDWCLVVDGKNGPLHYCKRVREERITSGGTTYVLVRETDQCGVYESEEQNERAKREWLEEQKKLNPTKYSGYKPKKPSTTNKPDSAVSGYVNRSEYVNDFLLPTEDDDRLDKVYRGLLSCLILEERHEKLLRDEWGDKMFDEIVKLHPIKTLPMVDAERFNYGAYYTSPWRKNIMQKLLEIVDKEDIISEEDKTGIPMFYQLGNGDLTFYKLSGIVFPVYNTRGKIIRLRVKVDFPNVKAVYGGKEGDFYFAKDGWYFKTGDSKPELVYQPKNKVYKVKLDKNGIPLSDGGKKSKVSGKYKNLSSFQEIYDDDQKKIQNRYLNGCQSGSYPSLYCRPTDDFTVVYFTEGEKKAMIANLLLGAPCVSFPGVGTFKTAFEARCDKKSIVDYCVEHGMKRGVLCYDADKNNNKVVLMQETNCVKWFLENKIQLSIGAWNEAFGKGLDDILLQGIRPTIHDVK